MFGYVRPCQGELRVRELTAYRAVYCGVCSALGKRCSGACRMFLQYDFALLALTVDLVLPEALRIEPGRCAALPLQRLPVASGEAVAYAADAHGILLYAKSVDDAGDKGSLRLLRRPLHAWTKRAALHRPHLAAAADALLSQQSVLEAAQAHYEAASEPFAVFCAEMFAPPGVPGKHREALRWLGLNLGRWIYLADALDDYERDKKRGNYNPFFPMTREEAAQALLPEMGLCAKQMAAALDVLPDQRNVGIVRNILEEGLYDTAEAIAANTFRREPHRRPPFPQ